MKKLIILLTIILFTGCTQIPDTSRYIVTRIVDGDTIVVDSSIKIRLIGIDTPEFNLNNSKPPQKCAGESKRLAQDKLLHQTVKLVRDGNIPDEDVFGRLLRYVVLDGEDYGEFMIRNNLAVEYTYGKQEYKNQEFYKSISNKIECGSDQ